MAERVPDVVVDADDAHDGVTSTGEGSDLKDLEFYQAQRPPHYGE